LQVEDLQDVRALLRSFCLAQTAPTSPSQADACYLATAAGTAVSQQELAQAASQRLTAESQSEQEKATAERQFERAGDAQNARLNAISNSVSAIAASTPTIQETAAQNQVNLQEAAAAAQQRQQAQEQARLAAEQSARAAQASTASTRPAPTLSNSGTGSGPIQGSCTDMTGSVQGSVKIGTDGWVAGYLTNSSAETLYVFYTFKQNGVPSNEMGNAGGTSVIAGQTVGGEAKGLYSTGADKDQARFYWYAVRETDHNNYGCTHKW
jgi:hypothetical protein